MNVGAARIAVRVSLFTREWIEMPAPNRCLMFAVSPSLRGSGLKSISIGDETLETVGLPLYEGVD